MFKLLSIFKKVKILSASNASTSGFGILAAVGLYYIQGEYYDFTEIAKQFGTTTDAFIIGCAWSVDVFFTELSIRFPKLKEISSSIFTAMTGIFSKMPQTYSANNAVEKDLSNTNLKTKNGNKVNG